MKRKYGQCSSSSESSSLRGESYPPSTDIGWLELQHMLASGYRGRSSTDIERAGVLLFDGENVVDDSLLGVERDGGLGEFTSMGDSSSASTDALVRADLRAGSLGSMGPAFFDSGAFIRGGLWATVLISSTTSFPSSLARTDALVRATVCLSVSVQYAAADMLMV